MKTIHYFFGSCFSLCLCLTTICTLSFSQTINQPDKKTKENNQSTSVEGLELLETMFPELGSFVDLDPRENKCAQDELEDFTKNLKRANKSKQREEWQKVQVALRQGKYFSSLNWEGLADSSLISAFINARFFSSFDVKLLQNHLRRARGGYQSPIEQFGQYFSNYQHAKNEFEKHRLESSLRNFLEAREEQLISTEYFMIICCPFEIEEYSFDKQGFNYNIWSIQPYGRSSPFEINLHGDDLNGYNSAPDFIPMNETAAQDFIHKWPKRTIKAFILCKPASTDMQGDLFVRISFIIFTTLDREVMYIYPTGSIPQSQNAQPDQQSNVAPSSSKIDVSKIEKSIQKVTDTSSFVGISSTKYKAYKDSLKLLKDNDYFITCRLVFNYPYLKVWDAITLVLNQAEEEIKVADKKRGIIFTHLTQHSKTYSNPSHQTQSAFFIDPYDAKSTVVYVKGFYYDPDQRFKNMDIWTKTGSPEWYSKLILEETAKVLN